MGWTVVTIIIIISGFINKWMLIHYNTMAVSITCMSSIDTPKINAINAPKVN